MAKRPHQEEIEEEKEYEVEKILKFRYDKNTKQKEYFVKWKNYNEWTWEPEDNLIDCPGILQDFLERRRLKKIPKHLRSGRLKSGRINGMEGNVVNESFTRQFHGRNPSVSYDAASKTYVITAEATTEEKKDELANVQKELVEWESSLNDICLQHDTAGITVENQVDMAGPPKNFTYINTYTSGEEAVEIPDICVGCDCADCEADTCLCVKHAGEDVRFAYDSDGLLQLCQGEPIFECNRFCKCSPACSNRVVQKGRAMQLCIFRTNNGRGWGVKALSPIKKGQFVAEYIGEIVTTEAAEKRLEKYNPDERTYLFDLDFHAGESEGLEIMYTIDAGRKGNISHFINHSCEPNLTVHSTWIEHLEVGIDQDQMLK